MHLTNVIVKWGLESRRLPNNQGPKNLTRIWEKTQAGNLGLFISLQTTLQFLNQ